MVGSEETLYSIVFKLEILVYYFFLVACVLFNSLTVPGSESKLLNSYREEPGGILRISSDRDDRRSFLGLKIFDFGIFFGQLDLRRDFFGHS